jgi:hypothetical protein
MKDTEFKVGFIVEVHDRKDGKDKQMNDSPTHRGDPEVSLLICRAVNRRFSTLLTYRYVNITEA